MLANSELEGFIPNVRKYTKITEMKPLTTGCAGLPNKIFNTAGVDNYSLAEKHSLHFCSLKSQSSLK